MRDIWNVLMMMIITESERKVDVQNHPFGWFTYRVSYKTWQLVNSFQCLLPWYCISYIRFFCRLFRLKNLLLKYTFVWNQFTKILLPYIFLIIIFGSNNLKNYGRRHFKLFINCHVTSSFKKLLNSHNKKCH